MSLVHVGQILVIGLELGVQDPSMGDESRVVESDGIGGATIPFDVISSVFPSLVKNFVVF